MSAKKITTSQSVAPALPGRQRPAGRGAQWFILALIIAGGLAVGWYALWQNVAPHVLSSDEYLVDPQQDIVVTPPPPWIHSDVKAEVIRDASLDGPLSILQEDLTKRIAQAFALHPWVASVQRVRKDHPARIQVDLIYRQPVAMVAVQGGLLPVDAEGVLLPSGDFPSEQAKLYPRIGEINTAPAPVGTPWGDSRVKACAQIAAAIGSQWPALKLYGVYPAPRGLGTRNDDFQFELATQKGNRVLWGHCPGAEIRTEMAAADKVRRLLEYADAHGSLDGGSEPSVFDLRGPELRVGPAIGSLPNSDPAR